MRAWNVALLLLAALLVLYSGIYHLTMVGLDIDAAI